MGVNRSDLPSRSAKSHWQYRTIDPAKVTPAEDKYMSDMTQAKRQELGRSYGSPKSVLQLCPCHQSWQEAVIHGGETVGAMEHQDSTAVSLIVSHPAGCKTEVRWSWGTFRAPNGISLVCKTKYYRVWSFYG